MSERPLVKPEIIPISEAEARELLRSGKAQKTSSLRDRLFTLYLSLGVFVLITGSLITYFQFIAPPLLLFPPPVAPVIESDSLGAEVIRDQLLHYNTAPSAERIEALASDLLVSTKNPGAGTALDVLEQLIAWNLTDTGRRFALTTERWCGQDKSALFRLYRLKAHLAYREKNYEESLFYLKMLLKEPNPYQSEAQKAVDELNILLDSTFWPDW